MNNTKFDKNTRIVIIGAGAAGLSAANALKQKGYEDITILEKLDRPGGKSLSFFVDGRSYELGTNFLAPYYKNTFKLFKEFNLDYQRFTQKVQFFNTDGSVIEFKKMKDWTTVVKILWEILFIFPVITFKYRKIYQPGFSNIPSELYQPFSTFCRSHQITNIYSFVKKIITNFGYGYSDDISTAYFFKYLRLSLLISFFFRRKNIFPEQGWGNIFSEISKHFHVIYNQNIIKITRNEKIVIQTETEIYEFDKIIIACPLDNFINIVDISPKSKDLLSKIEYHDYYCLAFAVDNLPNINKAYIVGDNQLKENQPSLLCWWRRWIDSNICTFYTIANPKDSAEKVESKIKADIEKLGGKIIEKYYIKKWKYFPHVSPEVMQDGFYEKLEKCQGKNNTYITGEIMNFSLVESVIEYSKFLIEKYF